MAAKKSKATASETTSASAGNSVYDAALEEIKNVGDSDASRRKVETGPLREGRGQDVIRLHTTLKAIDVAHGNLTSQVEEAHSDANAHFEKTWEAQTEGFEKTWKALETKFDKTWESLGTNFDATNERTKREIHDLREEIAKTMDKRFTHIDQTFASLRADIEVLKALQMELIKERIGRPEIVKR